jgi:UDPglucose--hexose-1-phosphate uridylyltransferase
MPPQAIVAVINTWIDVYNSLIPPLQYVQIFENKGQAMGCSNPHPHCQVWATNHIPHEPLTEFRSQFQYWKTHHSCMLCDYVELEIRKKERIVVQKGNWVAVCPYWAVWPYEVLLLPTKHISALPQLSEQDLIDLAKILSAVTVRFDNLFQCSFPYSMGVHQAPLEIPKGEGFDKDIIHMHFHFYPPLLRSATVRKFLVGYIFPDF